jgi:tetratricopeptide (TPR) repeat protein
MRRSTLGGILDRALEVTWLAAVITLPSFVNVYSVRAFEGDKVPFLRSLALVTLALCVARRLEAVEGPPRIVWRQPLVIATIALLACAVIANLASIAPAIAFWGAYDRVQGTYTLLAYAVLFFVFISTANAPRVDRLLDAALIGSIPPSAYALLQVFGIDPIAWDAMVQGRVHSTAGNPIFLGAYLILVMPLALVRVLGAVEEKRAGGAALYFAILVLNGVALACTQSRGPLLALAAGVVVFLLAALARRRLLVAARGGAALVAAFAVTALCVRALPLPARWDAAAATDPAAGNALVRLLLWRGTADLVRSNPRPFGYGLDTFRLVFPPFSPPALAPLEKREAVADRAHNDAFDNAVHLGLVGLVIRFALLVALLKVLLEASGIDGGRWTFFVAVVVAAALASIAMNGSFFGLAVGAGLLLALGLHLIRCILTAPIGNPAPTSARDLVGFGLLAAVTAHVAELQVGIPTATTELYFWMFAAGAVVLARDRQTPEHEDGSGPLLLGAGVAILLGAVVFMFLTPATQVDPHAHVMATLLGTTWLGGLAIATAPATTRWSLAGAINFALASLGGAAAFALPYFLWINSQPTRRDALVTSDYITHFVSVWYCGAFLLILFGGAVAFLSARRREAPFSVRPALQAVALPPLLGLAVWLAVVSNLAVSRADTYAKLGSIYERRKDWSRAAAIYGRACDLRGNETAYAIGRARVFLTLGTETASTDAVAAGAAFARAEEAAALAWETNPLETDSAALIARVNRRIATTLPQERGEAVMQADHQYSIALGLSPNRVALWQEYAEFLLETDQPEKALGALDRALALDANDAALHGLRARVCLKLERFEDALAAFDAVLAAEPRTLAALTGRGYTLTRLGRPREAIDAYLRALEIVPDDVVARRSLAALYRDQGQIDAALEHALAAAERSHGSERAQIEQLVGELEARRAKPAREQ